MSSALVFVVAAYLIGSISFAVVASALFRLPDPRSYGSGNPGATNVLRTGSKGAAALTLVGDGVKGFVAVWIAQTWGPEAEPWTVPLAALAVFFGHLYPVFHRFKGGKGVATAAGVVAALSIKLFVALTVIWFMTLAVSRISSLSALVAAALLPLGAFYYFGNAPETWITVVVSAMLFWRHRANLKKLAQGTERKLGE